MARPLRLIPPYTKILPLISARLKKHEFFPPHFQNKNPPNFFPLYAGVCASIGVCVSALRHRHTSVSVCEAPYVDWKSLRADIVEVLNDDEYMEEPPGPIFVRLAWHASGTYDKATNTGGSNGATMRFTPECDDGANTGLHIARKLLASLKLKYPNVSHADLWVYAGVVAIEEMGGPSVPFRPGRVDAHTGDTCPPHGRLPHADKGTIQGTAQGLREVFGRMGFVDKEIVALSGAHALGRCHPERSGYKGPWTNSPTTFSNEFFRLLLEEEWKLREKDDDGTPWKGNPQYENKAQDLMMLPSDMVLVQDVKFKEWVIKFAKDEALFFEEFKKAFKKLTENGVDI